MKPTLPMLAALALLALIVVPIVLRVVIKLFMRSVARAFLSGIGEKALAQQPDAIELRRETFVSWRDPAAMEALAKPLTFNGFQDCGVYTADKLPAFKIWFLLKESDGVAAFLYEHPKVPSWIELSVRYEDGTTTALSTLQPTGIDMSPPFYRRIVAPSGTPTDQLYHRILKERPQQGIKRVTAATVVAEFEAAYMKLIAWQKNKGISPEEVAAVGKKWLEKRQAQSGAAPTV
ncbi:MAG: hypothetical protein HY077_09510 [Elusimicrobia bacterium]|nr:hypothetical protein [Elusimicrobiota bacterium]